MRHFITFAVVLALAAPAIAQDTTSTSGSNAGAVSGSNSGAASDQAQSQGQTMNGNVGRSDASSASNSGAVSGSASDSRSLSDQTQGQSSNNSNAASNSNTVGQQVGQSASNSQGVSVQNNFNSSQRRFTKEEVRTNAAVPLTASSSFSSDFCGSTQSGGASASPIGISLGIAGTKYDQTCRSLRVAEKAGMLAVSANNMGFKDLSSRLTALATWNVCMANGPDLKAACEKLALFGTPEGGPLPSREEALKAITSETARQQQEAAQQPPASEHAVAVASALPASVVSPR